MSNQLLLRRRAMLEQSKKVTIHGIPPITVSGKTRLLSVKTFGECVQNSTPTIDNPVDIMCNNGVLKARHQSGLPIGYTLLEYIKSTGTQYIDTGVYISTGYKVRVKAYATSIYSTIAFFGCTSIADASNAKKGIYRIIGSSVNRCAWGNINGSVVDLIGNDSINTWYDMVCDNGVWTINDELFATCPESSFTSEYSMWLFARNTGGEVGLPAPCRISVSQIWDNNGQMIQNLVPCKNVSNVIGMYDLVSGRFFTNQGTYDFTAGDTVSDPVEIYTDGTAETITITSGGTATVEMLLKVGDYQDVQSILDGVVTRNIGVCVYDGLQIIGDTFISTTGGKDIGAIIVYPLATPTTEQVAGQTLALTSGTNVIDITQANLQGLELEVIAK